MTEEEKKERDLKARKFYRAEQEAGFAEAAPHQTPQTRHPAYRLAFRDTDFLLREELRPVRFQLELLKPEMLLDEAGVGSTLVMYGSARIPPPEAAQVALDGAKDLPDDERIVVERLVEKSKYYAEAYQLARLVSEKSITRVQNSLPNSTTGIGFILPVWISVSSSKNSSNVPNPPGNTATARARSRKCILRSAK